MSQRGFALLTGLVFLVMISLLASVAANSMILQRHQAANFQEKTRAEENAAIAEAQARSWVFSRPDIDRQSGCITDCVLPAAIRNQGDLGANPEFESIAWWRTNGTQAGFHPESGEAVTITDDGQEAARWIAEEIQYVPAMGRENDPAFEGLAYYRILSRGSGLQAGTVAVTEAIVARPWEGAFDIASFPEPASSLDFCGQFRDEFPCGTIAWRKRR